MKGLISEIGIDIQAECFKNVITKDLDIPKHFSMKLKREIKIAERSETLKKATKKISECTQ